MRLIKYKALALSLVISGHLSFTLSSCPPILTFAFKDHRKIPESDIRSQSCTKNCQCLGSRSRDGGKKHSQSCLMQYKIYSPVTRHIHCTLQGARFSGNVDLENRRLLWHGTNIAVVAAILRNGLRIMPHSGGRVGRGIYFASENSKSACYGEVV